jgi:hypothetical protein
MRRTHPVAVVRAAGVVGVLMTGSLVARAQTDAALEPLFDGTLAGWTIENDAPVSVTDGVLRIDEPRGWLRSNEQYGDFLLRAEFRFVNDDTDSGLFVRAVADGTFGPGWPSNAYQVQLRNPIGESRFPPVGGVFRHGKPEGETRFDPADAERLSLGTGVWQTLEVVVEGDTLSVELNGEPLTEALAIENPSGYIGIQAERGAIEFRAIEIAER